jgi:hypothetical protein
MSSSEELHRESISQNEAKESNIPYFLKEDFIQNNFLNALFVHF